MSKIEAGITSQNIEDADGDLELTDLLRNWARWANHGDDGGPQQATTCASAERHHPIPVWEEEESPPKPPDELDGQRVENALLRLQLGRASGRERVGPYGKKQEVAVLL